MAGEHPRGGYTVRVDEVLRGNAYPEKYRTVITPTGKVKLSEYGDRKIWTWEKCRRKKERWLWASHVKGMDIKKPPTKRLSDV